MTHPTDTCRDVNAYGHICGLPLCHDEPHLQDIGTATISWFSRWVGEDDTYTWPTTEPSPAAGCASRT